MKIGIFTDTYYPQVNGVVSSVCTLEKELTALGHDVYIFTVANSAVPRSKIDKNVYRLPSMPLFFVKPHRLAFHYSPRLLFKMRKLRLDIVHTQTEFALGFFGKLVARVFKLPLVHTYHTMYEDYVHYIGNGHFITPKLAQRFSRFFCNHSNAVIAPAEKTQVCLLEYGVKKPIHIIPTGIDFSPFSSDKYSTEDILETKKELGLNPDDPVVLFVGRLAKEKSIEVLINQMPALLEMLPNCKLVIIGDGPIRATLESLAQELGVSDSVIFAGQKPWEYIGKYYAVGDVFTTASTSETQGLTYIEAMAAKIPVVAKRDQSVKDIITDGETGLYFDEPEELPKKLFTALTDKVLVEKIIKQGYSCIQPLSAEAFGQNLIKLYEAVKPEKKKRVKTKIK